MLSALIVDDEFEIRNGLCNRFPWENFGFNEVLVADDGDTALSIAMDRRPDMILTDIKMKKKSGLEFLRYLQSAEDYKPEAVVVSGYDDFGLVKQAMQMGVLDYILKPINLDELSEIVRKTVEIIHKKRMNQNNEQMLSQIRFAIPKMREELLRELLERSYDASRIMRIQHRINTLNLNWMTHDYMTLIAIEADDLKAIGNRRINEKELVIFGIGNVVNQTLEEEYPYPFTICMDSASRWIILLRSNPREQSALARGIASLCLQRINDFVKVNASAGLSATTGTIEHLHEMFQEATELLAHKAVFGGNRVLTHGLLPGSEEYDNGLPEDPAEVIDFIKYGTDEEIRSAMNGFVDLVQSWQLTHLRDIQQRIFEWLFEIFRLASAAGAPRYNALSNPIAMWELLEQYDTLQSLREQTEKFLLNLAADFRELSASPSQIVSEAEKIIRSDYADNLTLQSVASAVHVTPVWLSKLFKKEKRKTFLEYLTEVRIERAKEMLSDIKYKVYQVSYQVGYKDPVHFSKLFKKQVGCTPKEFRRQRGLSDE
ncbi:response regulator [Paenibacillus pinihumi]|uniref:response regulator n=1 Tax=Paenibacillus pinihumi TaxID=669462 RepID=UPI00040CB031|nr:response regulator [Paenibacillus pinihumi]